MSVCALTIGARKSRKTERLIGKLIRSFDFGEIVISFLSQSWRFSPSNDLLRLLFGFGADRRGDVGAHLRDRMTVRGRERLEAVGLHGLARSGAARTSCT